MLKWMILFLLFISFLPLSGCHIFWGEVPEGSTIQISRISESKRQELIRWAQDNFSEPRELKKVLDSYQYYIQTFSERDQFESLWRVANVCSWLAEYHPKEDERLEYAKKGAALAKECINRVPSEPGGHYYYALNLGLMSQLESGGVNRLKLMDQHAKEVVKLDPNFEYAGGHRFLGMFYFETLDSLAFSQGTFEDALMHLEKACEIAPEYGLNQLALARLLIDDEDFETARHHLKLVIESRPPTGEKKVHKDWVREAECLIAELPN